MVRPETIIESCCIPSRPVPPLSRTPFGGARDPSQRVLETAPARGGNRGGGIAPTVATAWRGGEGGWGAVRRKGCRRGIAAGSREMRRGWAPLGGCAPPGFSPTRCRRGPSPQGEREVGAGDRPPAID